MKRMRWLMLLLGIILFSIVSIRGETREALIAFGLGMIAGLFIDWLGIAKFHLWSYPRQSLMGLKYFLIVIPAWGVFGMAINIPWNWIASPWVALGVLTLALFLLHELPNLKTGSWKYQSPTWLVVIGWLPLVLSCRFLFEAVRSWM